MFSYNIAKVADNQAFQKVCADIESKMRGIQKESLLVDVDGTLIQIYKASGGSIKVVNDYEVDAVYADSDIDLTGII